MIAGVYVLLHSVSSKGLVPWYELCLDGTLLEYPDDPLSCAVEMLVLDNVLTGGDGIVFVLKVEGIRFSCKVGFLFRWLSIASELFAATTGLVGSCEGGRDGVECPASSDVFGACWSFVTPGS